MSKNNWGGDPNAEFRFRDPVQGEVLEAGEYLVIDPCYVFGDPQSLWDKICGALFHDGVDKSQLVMEVDTPDKTHKVVIWGTAYGDGVYPVLVSDNEVGTCGVDAGLLCFIPKALIDEIEGNDGLGTWVTLPADSPIQFCGDSDGRGGDVEVGPIYVCTCGCIDDADADAAADEYDEEEEAWFDDEEDEESDYEEEESEGADDGDSLNDVSDPSYDDELDK